MKNLWIFLSLFVTFITTLSVIIMKYLSNSKCNIKTLTFMTFLISAFFILIYIPFDDNVKNDIIKNINMKDCILIIFFSLVLIINRLSQVYLFKITPNIGLSHLIVNTNVILTLLASYLLFNQVINMKSFLGIIITLIGLYIVISNNNF